LRPDRSVDYAFIVLLSGDSDAVTVAGVIEDLLVPQAQATVLIPPMRGTAFLADTARQADMDAWWRSAVPASATPVSLFDHDEDLPPWLAGLDGLLFVRCDEMTRLAYTGAGVRPVVAATPMHFIAQVLTQLADEHSLFDPLEMRRLLAFTVKDEPQMPARRERAAASGEWERESFSATEAHAPRRSANFVALSPHPFELLAAMPKAEPRPAVPNESNAYGGDVPRRLSRHARRFSRWRPFRFDRGDRPPLSEDDLAALLSQRGPTIVAVGSRKGGVGKTSHSAGLAIVAGGALDRVGHRAAIVDANIANPDAWGVLNLPPGAATLRDAIAAISMNREPPRPVHAATPALACYPEARDSSEYSRAEIDRFASYLRRQYSLIVIDLSNRLPDTTGGPEAAAAAFWLEVADVVVLPAAAAKQDLNGVLDFLDVPDLPPAVVAYIVPNTRRSREHPLTQRYLAAIEQRAARIVEVPDEAEPVRFAVMEGIPLDSVSPRLRAAYRRLTEAVISVRA
jgi:MinD-like ATPase involved in chromosome partitioning or flagellar assembly